MEDNQSLPLFKKIDQRIFEGIDKFKTSPNYNNIQDFYNSLDEEQQKLFKGIVILLIFILPISFLGFLSWQNSKLSKDLELRKSIITKASEILGQSQGIRDISPRVFSMNPIDSDSMMNSRLSSIASTSGIDTSKVRIENFTSDVISNSVNKAEADFKFNNLSTDELMNLISNMIQLEKFRISTISIKRNPDTSMLSGSFHSIHYSNYSPSEEQD
jgi:hypothetical protein